jgi:hypothetical protein
MKIALIGKFDRFYDEEYIACSFEMLGHTVKRIPETALTHQIIGMTEGFNPDVVLCTKLFCTEPSTIIEFLKSKPYKFVSWNFDLYWGYPRENRLKTTPGFKADYVFTTDGGHDEKWKEAGINHKCVRQGISASNCYLAEGTPSDIVFVGSHNALYPYRQQMLKFVKKNYPLKWYGADNTNEVRNENLNKLYANSKIVIGDSVYSPFYWSNRVVETLGRGGFLIHPDVPGLKDEYPYLVTYKHGDFADLKSKIDYYLLHEDDPKELVLKNFEWVKNNYTMDKKCAELLSKL